MNFQIKKKWLSVLKKRYPQFPEEFLDDYIVGHLESIYEKFIDSGLADSKFESQLGSEIGYSYHQAMSEMLLSDRLFKDGFELSSKNSGPDFKATKNDRVFWFEIITPEPKNGIEESNSNQEKRLCPDAKETNELYLEQLLRITAAIKEKKEKFEKYINSDEFEVTENDVCIIVINDSLLEPFDLPMYGLTQEISHGESGLPLSVEALYGVGIPYWYEDVDGANILVRSQRNEIYNKNASPIKLCGFNDDSLSIISGVFGLTLREDYALTILIPDIPTNKGIFVENNFSKNKVSDSELSAKFISYDFVKSLLSPSPQSKNHNNAIQTIHGKKIAFFRYINKLYGLDLG